MHSQKQGSKVSEQEKGQICGQTGQQETVQDWGEEDVWGKNATLGLWRWLSQ